MTFSKKRYLKPILTIALLAVMVLTVSGCEDYFNQFSPPETPEEKPEPEKVTKPTTISSEDKAILAVYEHLLNQAESAEAKVYLAEFYTACDNWSAESELFKDGSSVWYVLIDMTEVDPSMAGGGGGHALVTTAEDLSRFLDALLAGELFQDEGTLDEMMTFVDGPNPWGETPLPGIDWEKYKYGLGMEKLTLADGGELIGHAGSTAGYASFVYYLPSEDFIIEATINTMDLPSMLYQVLIPALNVLAP